MKKPGNITMDEKSLRKKLANLPLGEIRFLHQTSSTNDLGLAWATEGAPDYSLVVADEQTSGRGRSGRRWLTPAGSALAVSLILHPTPKEREHISLLSGLGALALTQLLTERGLSARIKWPNDILISNRKTAGILVEVVWMGEQIENAVVGIGVNVLPESVPPASEIQFPATSIHSEGLKIDRLELIYELLVKFMALRPRVGEESFILDWEASLAFMNETVRVSAESPSGLGAHSSITGIVRGLEHDGALRLETASGIQRIQFGEIHLRPV
jgi:BirA family transcriptional regulator, biotin operon repressor / biotin---[acetyl-CoA-carboxylase] ligase